MKLNELIAQALNKPVEALTIEDVNKALTLNVKVYHLHFAKEATFSKVNDETKSIIFT